MPASAAVGISGSTGERVGVVTMSGRTLPPWIWVSAVGDAAMMRSTLPESSATLASLMPLYGMCVMSTFASERNRSVTIWFTLPTPAEP